MSQPVQCPWCGFQAVNVTLSEDHASKYLCTGPEGHRWRAGEEPPPEPQDEPVGLDDIADAVAARVKEQLQKPSLFQRIFSRS